MCCSTDRCVYKWLTLTFSHTNDVKKRSWGLFTAEPKIRNRKRNFCLEFCGSRIIGNNRFGGDFAFAQWTNSYRTKPIRTCTQCGIRRAKSFWAAFHLFSLSAKGPKSRMVKVRSHWTNVNVKATSLPDRLLRMLHVLFTQNSGKDQRKKFAFVQCKCILTSFQETWIEKAKHGKLLHEELIQRVYILWCGVNIAIFTKTSSVVYIMDGNTSEHSNRFHVKVLNVDGSRRNLFFQKCWMNSNFLRQYVVNNRSKCCF